MHDPEPKTLHPEPGTKAEARDRRRTDVQLAVMVPPHARDDVRRQAFEQGTTIRAIILRALVATGVTRLDEADLVDRRI
jgi:hypothetical protein